jgi:hypothetical protein
VADIPLAAACLQILIHISIGRSLSSFSDVINGETGSSWDIVFLVIGNSPLPQPSRQAVLGCVSCVRSHKSASALGAGIAVGLGVGVYLYFRTKQHLQQYVDEIGGEEETQYSAAPEDEEQHNDHDGDGDEESAEDLQQTQVVAPTEAGGHDNVVVAEEDTAPERLDCADGAVAQSEATPEAGNRKPVSVDTN